MCVQPIVRAGLHVFCAGIVQSLSDIRMSIELTELAAVLSDHSGAAQMENSWLKCGRYGL